MRIKYDQKLWDVFLKDDGTLDTVISVQPVAPKKVTRQGKEFYPELETRFDMEYASQFRRASGELTLIGLRTLGLEAIEDYSADLEDLEAV